jgi:malonyl-CoA O-methyltransferase
MEPNNRQRYRNTRHDFSAAATQYESYAQLQQHMAEEVAALAQILLARREAPRVMDAGCGTGFLLFSLARARPQWRMIGLDFAPAMCVHVKRNQRAQPVLCADMEAIPLADGTLDAIVSSAAVQWVPDATAMLREWGRVLKPGGMILLASFGPGTLRELRTAFSAVSDAPHVQDFLSLSELKQAASEAGFSSLQAMQRIEQLPYASPAALMQQLKAIGARNKRDDRPRGLMTPRKFAAVQKAYPQPPSASGHIMASWEILMLALQKDA